MELAEINQAVEELKDAIHQIQQPRSNYALQHFVVGEKDTEPMRYSQCLLELQVKHGVIRRAIISQKKLVIERERLLEDADPIKQLEAEEKQIDIEETKLAMTGAVREFECLYRIFKAFPKQYTHEELQAAQDEYWQARLIRQAEQDIAASGRIGVGNLDALRMAGAEVEERKEGRFYTFAPSALPALK